MFVELIVRDLAVSRAKWRIVVVCALTGWSREFFLLEGKQMLIDPMGSQGTEVKDFFSRQSFAIFCIALMRTNTLLFEEPSGRLKSLKLS